MQVQTIGVFVIVLMKSSNKVLLLRRKNSGLYDGKFSVPGGKRKNKEPEPKAAMRELHEETGLVVEDSELLIFERLEGNDPDGTQWTSTFYVAESWAGKLQKQREPDKHDMVDWYSIENLPKNIIPAVRDIICNLAQSHSLVTSSQI